MGRSTALRELVLAVCLGALAGCNASRVTDEAIQAIIQRFCDGRTLDHFECQPDESTGSYEVARP